MPPFFHNRHFFSLPPKRWIYFSDSAGAEASSEENAPPVERSKEAVPSVDSSEKVESKLNVANQQLEQLSREFEDPNGPYKALSPDARKQFEDQIKTKIEALKAQTTRETELIQQAEQAVTELATGLKEAIGGVKKEATVTPTGGSSSEVGPSKLETSDSIPESDLWTKERVSKSIQDLYSKAVEYDSQNGPINPDDPKRVSLFFEANLKALDAVDLPPKLREAHLKIFEGFKKIALVIKKLDSTKTQFTPEEEKRIDKMVQSILNFVNTDRVPVYSTQLLDECNSILLELELPSIEADLKEFKDGFSLMTEGLKEMQKFMGGLKQSEDTGISPSESASSPDQLPKPIIEKITEQKNWISKIVKEHIASEKGASGEALRKNLAEHYGLKPYPATKEDPSGQKFVEKLFSLSTGEMQKFNEGAKKVKVGDTITLNPDGSLVIETSSPIQPDQGAAGEKLASAPDAGAPSAESGSIEDRDGKSASLGASTGEKGTTTSADAAGKPGSTNSAEVPDIPSDGAADLKSPQEGTAVSKEDEVPKSTPGSESSKEALEGTNEKAAEALKKRIQEAFPEAEVYSCKITNVMPDDISAVDVHTEIVLVVRGDVFRIGGQGTDNLVPNSRESSIDSAFYAVSKQVAAKLERDRTVDQQNLSAYPLFADRFKDQMKDAHHITISHEEQVDGDQFRTTMHLEMTVRGKVIKMDKPGPPAPTREQALRSASMRLFKDLPKAYDEAQKAPQSTIPSEIPEKDAFNPDQFFRDSLKDNGNGSVAFDFYNPNKKEVYKGKLANGMLTLVDKRGFVLSLPLRYKQAPGARAAVDDQGGYSVSEGPPSVGRGEYPIPDGDQWIDVRSGRIGMTPDGLQKMMTAVMASLEPDGGLKLPFLYPISNNKKGVPTNGKLSGSGMLQLG